MEEGRYEDAIASFKDYKLDQDSFYVHSYMGSAYASLGRDDEAIKEYEIATSLDSPDKNFKAGITIQKGNIYAKLGKYPEAMRAYEKVISINPGDRTIVIDAIYHKALVLSELGRDDEAIKEYEKLVSLYRDKSLKAKAILQKGKLYSKQGKYSEAIKEYEKVLSLDPEDKSVKIEAFTQKINALLIIGETRKATKEYEDHLLQDENITAQMVRIYYNIGSNCERKRLFEEAIKNFKKVINLSSKLSSIDTKKFGGGAHFHLGIAYKNLGEEEKAKDEFLRCLKLIPEHKKAKEELNNILKEKRNYADIRKDS